MEKQRNLTFDQGRRAGFLIAKGNKLPTLNTAQLVQLVLGTVLVVLGIAASGWSTVIAVAAVVAGLFLILRSFMMRRRQSR